jgi:prepilin-type N-terminal cleavage/methylation domain-containing protein
LPGRKPEAASWLQRVWVTVPFVPYQGEFMRSIKRSEGFTLIELMIVVAIIGILAAIAIPNFLKFQCKSKQSEAKVNLAGIFTAETAFFGEYNTYGTDLVSVNWQPDGAPLYLYGFFPALSYPTTPVTGLPSYLGANDTTAISAVIYSPARYATTKMNTLAGALLTPALSRPTTRPLPARVTSSSPRRWVTSNRRPCLSSTSGQWTAKRTWWMSRTTAPADRFYVGAGAGDFPRPFAYGIGQVR